MNVLLLLLAVSTVSAATPTEKKRAFASNGLTCYYQCPSPVTDIDIGTVYFQELVQEGEISYCYYVAGGFCAYNTETGEFADVGFIEDCPGDAPGPVCDSVPPGGFKRSVRGHSHDDPAVSQRQYRPSRRVQPAPVTSMPGPTTV